MMYEDIKKTPKWALVKTMFLIFNKMHDSIKNGLGVFRCEIK